MKGKQDHSQQDSTAVTLDPLRDKGPAALDARGAPAIKDVTLHRLALAWDNTRCDQTILESDDLLKMATAKTPIPQVGHLASATFKFHPANADDPHFFTVQPPNKVALQCAADGPHVFAWLDQNGLRLLSNITSAVVAILLAIAAALAPCMGDGDGDDDDPDGDRLSLRA